MSNETFIKVQVCELQVGIRCAACVKEVKKILHRTEGVYQTKIDAQQGKVTVIGQMDMDTVLRKLKKAGKSAKLWNENPEVASVDQMHQLGDGGKGLPLGEASGSYGAGCHGGGTTNATGVLPHPTPAPPLQQAPAPAPPLQPTPAPPLQRAPAPTPPLQPTPAPPLEPTPAPAPPLQPTPAPQLQPTPALAPLAPPLRPIPAPAPPQQPTPAPPSQLNLQEQIEKRLQMMKGTKLPPHLMGGKTPFPVAAPASISDNKVDGRGQVVKEDGLTNMLGKPRMMMPMGMPPPIIGRGDKKVGAGTDIPAPMNDNPNHGNKRGATGMKQSKGARGSQVNNGILGSRINPGQKKNDGSVGGPLFSANGPMGDGMLQQQTGITRPPHNMMGQVGYGAMGGTPMGHYPAMGGNGMQHGGGGAMNGQGHGMPTTGGGISAARFYPNGASTGGAEMVQQVAGNPKAHQPYLMGQPPQEHLMMSGHGRHGEFGRSGPSYLPMGYGYGQLQGQPPMQYLPLSYYPMPLPPHPHDNIFSVENPNNCLVM